MILGKDEALEKLNEYYVTGGGRTYDLGFKALSKHYSIKEGGVTDWTGYPQSGKTEFMLECLINTSKWYGHKHLIYMPDAGTDEEIYSKILHKVTGKQVEEFYYNANGDKVKIINRLTEAEIRTEIDWLIHHFKIYKPESKDGKPKSVTPIQFWDYAVENKKSLGLFSAVIDSWNYMNHDTDGKREDKWLEETLSYRNWLAETSGMHFHTIIHPSKPSMNREGRIMTPDMYSLKGGSEWANNGKAIIVVHRDFGSPHTQIKIAKAKPRVVGVQGEVFFSYDLAIGKYTQVENRGDGYAINPKKVSEITPNNEFENETFETPF